MQIPAFLNPAVRQQTRSMSTWTIFTCFHCGIAIHLEDEGRKDYCAGPNPEKQNRTSQNHLETLDFQGDKELCGKAYCKTSIQYHASSPGLVFGIYKFCRVCCKCAKERGSWKDSQYDAYACRNCWFRKPLTQQLEIAATAVSQRIGDSFERIFGDSQSPVTKSDVLLICTCFLALCVSLAAFFKFGVLFGLLFSLGVAYGVPKAFDLLF